MDVIIAKVVSIICLFILTSISGLIPIWLVNRLKRRRNSNNEVALETELDSKHGHILSFLLNFGGGVLLATCFMHMLPEVRETFINGFVDEGRDAPKFPVIDGVFCLGFFFVYFIEELISYLLGHKTHSHFNGAAHEHSPVVVHCDNENGKSNLNVSVTQEETKLVESGPSTSYGTGAHKHSHTVDDQKSSGLKGLMIIIALSFHAIFEGMSIGLQSSSGSVWALFFGISIHKVVLAFCVGLETYLHGTRQTLVVIYMIVFAAMTPIGGGIGGVVDSVLVTSSTILSILQAIAAGTIMYVTFFEVFFQEKNSPQPGLLKFLSALIGFLVMSALSLLE